NVVLRIYDLSTCLTLRCKRFPYTTLFRSELLERSPSERRNTLLGELMFASHVSYSACGLGSPATDQIVRLVHDARRAGLFGAKIDRKSTRLNSSHVKISYAVFCLKKKRIT